MDFLLPCKLKVSKRDIQTECRKVSEDLYRKFGSVANCNNLLKNDIFYLAGTSSNRVWHKEADSLEHRNASGTTRALGIYALSLTQKKPTENLDRCVKLSKDNCPEAIKLLCDNLQNEHLIHKVSFIGSDSDICLIKERLKKRKNKTIS